jgi:hypothetical protein
VFRAFKARKVLMGLLSLVQEVLLESRAFKARKVPLGSGYKELEVPRVKLVPPELAAAGNGVIQA